MSRNERQPADNQLPATWFVAPIKMEVALAAFLRPFVLLILGVLILSPVRIAVQRYMKNGKLKRLLLTHVN